MVLETMIEYLESNLFCEIDYAELAKRAHYGKDNAARIFSASTDFTLAEYVRVRRLSEAGKRLSAGVGSIADNAYDCGYSTSESFNKAFKKFHGITPGECRRGGNYRYVPTWVCAPDARSLSYKIATIDMYFVGFGKRFVGKIGKRLACDEAFAIATRREQDALRLLRRENDVDWWEILGGFDENGYDYRLAVVPEHVDLDLDSAAKRIDNGEEYEITADEFGRIACGFERIAASGKYAIFTSEKRDFPMGMLDDFTKAVYDGIDDYGFVRDETRVDLLRIRWYKRAQIFDRYLELYIPVK